MTSIEDRAQRNLGVTRVRSAYEQVADQLRQLITSGELTPGDRLPTESELCQAFGVSRSTVREALRSLASQQLVYTSRGATGGTFVANSDPRAISSYLETSIGLLSADVLTVDEIMAVREMLEVPAARLAAEHRTADDLHALRSAVERETSVADPHHEGPRDFHDRMLAATHNSLLEIVAQPIFSVLRNRFARANTPAALWQDVHNCHREILAAIEQGDGDAAATAMRDHLQRHHNAYLDMDKMPRETSPRKAR